MTEISPGVVTIESRADGWFLVRIGRTRKVKQFWLSHAEASELAARLSAVLPKRGAADS